MLTEDDKKYILNEFLKTISHISDKDYQKRIWIRGEGPECDDFDETVCYFFEVESDILDHYGNFGITESQYHLLKNFRDELESFYDNNNYLPQDFIDTPWWTKITKMAGEVLVAFGYKIEGK